MPRSQKGKPSQTCIFAESRKLCTCIRELQGAFNLAALVRHSPGPYSSLMHGIVSWTQQHLRVSWSLSPMIPTTSSPVWSSMQVSRE